MSDPHFGHRNMTEKFTTDDGRRVRHEFQTVEECDEAIIANCNAVLQPDSKIYCIGDFAFSSDTVIKYRKRLIGNWSIILGNHDPSDVDAWAWRMPDGRRAFRKVQSLENFGPQKQETLFTVCHYPLHPMCLSVHHGRKRQLVCVHGHEHRTKVMDGAQEDPRYINLCVENWGYRPLHYDEIAAEIKKRGL